MHPVSKTAYYCCGIRKEDAEKSNPICGDNFARVFFDNEGLEIFKKFKERRLRNANAVNVTRHRIIDDMLKKELSRNPETPVILIGAGFDTRAYRLDGGVWYELDAPNLIAYKNTKLPAADCKNKLNRIPYDYTTDSLVEKLSFIKGDTRAIIIVEGVFGYLAEDAIQQLIASLQQSSGNHLLICDLAGYTFDRMFGRRLRTLLRNMGAPMTIKTNSPEKIFINNNYVLSEKKSIILRTAELGFLSYPAVLVKYFLKQLPNDYSIFVFEHNPANG